ncbi:hypothetical protein DFH07DRAFT_704892, partial [Mycena maculata]
LTLPPEITGQIFLHYVHNPYIGRTGEGAHNPLLLAGVCRSWRDICLSLHSLWSSLRIYPQDHSHSSLISLLGRWLPRAGSHLLDLELFRLSASTSAILSSLSAYSPRWRSLHLTMQTPSSLPEDRHIKGRIPHLSKLDLDVLEPYLGRPVTMFSHAPKLREVRLSAYSARPEWITLPWIQLTQLEFGCSLSGCLRVLAQTPHLEVLMVFITLMDRDPPPPIPQTLAHLRTLRYPRAHHGMLLDYLTLPALRTLELKCLEKEGCPRMRSLGVRSSWSLRSIHLVDMTSEIYMSCLWSLPSVEEV